ncbi:hypothetical protein LTR97_005692 [Elasticomyces elasticus]|uniref:Heterokaryon incompatibility domain-containing protein n=1 Tax=Elasticomyces elasticus TaxID=574655 RepID=A0AAN7W8I6_9PEZI|nr:hypothetical protein LTR97_005692 [Elasticomyces elasticus]
MTYCYEPLASDVASVRLVTLDPLRTSQQLHLRLENHRLGSSTIYNALSYEWGPPEPSEEVVVDGVTFIVRRNLRTCLKELQQTGRANRPIFIDAICIDQCNIPERNSQVQLMSDIYRGAQEVLVWLGPAVGKSDVLFDICNADDTLWTAKSNRIAGHDFVGINTFELADSLDELLSRSYWSRLWVIQEMYFAQSLVLCCGSRRMTLATLRRLCDAAIPIWGRHDVRITERWDFGAFEHLLTLVHMQSKRAPAGSYDLHLQVLRLRHCKCSEIKDKVYGLLGMHLDWLPADERPSVLKVEYEAPVELLWARVMASMTPHIDIAAALELLDVFQITVSDLETLTTKNVELEYRAEVEHMTFRVELLDIGITTETGRADGASDDAMPDDEDEAHICTLSGLSEDLSQFAHQRPQEWQSLQRCVCIVPSELRKGTPMHWIAGTHLVISPKYQARIGGELAIGVLADMSQELGVQLAHATLDGMASLDHNDVEWDPAEPGTSSCTSWLHVTWRSLLAILSSSSRDRPETLEYMALASSRGSSPAIPEESNS